MARPTTFCVLLRRPCSGTGTIRTALFLSPWVHCKYLKSRNGLSIHLPNLRGSYQQGIISDNNCAPLPWELIPSLPGSLLISEWVFRISSASFCAVGRTSVWCSDIKYCANFCSCSRLICNNVSAKKKYKKNPDNLVRDWFMRDMWSKSNSESRGFFFFFWHDMHSMSIGHLFTQLKVKATIQITMTYI